MPLVIGVSSVFISHTNINTGFYWKAHVAFAKLSRGGVALVTHGQKCKHSCMVYFVVAAVLQCILIEAWIVSERATCLWGNTNKDLHCMTDNYPIVVKLFAMIYDHVTVQERIASSYPNWSKRAFFSEGTFSGDGNKPARQLADNMMLTHSSQSRLNTFWTRTIHRLDLYDPSYICY